MGGARPGVEPRSVDYLPRSFCTPSSKASSFEIHGSLGLKLLSKEYSYLDQRDQLETKSVEEKFYNYSVFPNWLSARGQAQIDQFIVKT